MKRRPAFPSFSCWHICLLPLCDLSVQFSSAKNFFQHDVEPHFYVILCSFKTKVPNLVWFSSHSRHRLTNDGSAPNNWPFLPPVSPSTIIAFNKVVVATFCFVINWRHTWPNIKGFSDWLPDDRNCHLVNWSKLILKSMCTLTEVDFDLSSLSSSFDRNSIVFDRIKQIGLIFCLTWQNWYFHPIWHKGTS